MKMVKFLKCPSLGQGLKVQKDEILKKLLAREKEFIDSFWKNRQTECEQRQLGALDKEENDLHGSR